MSRFSANCAGLVSPTAELAMEACIRGRLHHLDIAAELDNYRIVRNWNLGQSKQMLYLCRHAVGVLLCWAVCDHIVERIHGASETDLP